MVDIETWGTRIGSVIVGVGAATFDPYGTGLDGCETFRANIDAVSAIKEGLTVDAATIYWWLTQSEGARRALVVPEPLPLRKVLADLVTWYRQPAAPKVTAVWSHGATFDLMLLQAAFGATGIKPPWHYRDMRDTRTLFDLASGYGYWDKFLDPITGLPIEAVEHDPLDDAIQQIEWVQRAYRLIGGPTVPF